MKILLISPLPPPSGGIATWTVNYIEYFRDITGIEIDIVNIAKKYSNSNRLNNPFRHMFYIVVEVIRTLRILSNMKKEIKNFSPEIIHLNSSCGENSMRRDLLLLKMIKRENIPVVYHCRCDVRYRLGFNELSHTLFSKVVKYVERIIVLNKQSLDFVQSGFYSKCSIIPNFIHHEMVLSGKRNIRDNIESIVYTGSIKREKGVFLILEVAKNFPDIEFILVGSNMEIFQNTEIAPNVQFKGELNKEQVIKILDSADLFLFPSYSEGFSNSLLEAMARGLPIIATRVGANEEMLEDKGGVMVDIGSSEQIIEAIDSLKSRDKRTVMSVWNTEKVLKEYTVDFVCNEYYKLYDAVLTDMCYNNVEMRE